MSSDFREAEFREYLSNVPGEKDVERTVEIARLLYEEANKSDADSFVVRMRINDSLLETMVNHGYDTFTDFVAMFRYAKFADDKPLYASILERVDATDVMPAVRKEVTSRYGEEKSDSIFAGINFPGPETPASKFPNITSEVLNRMTFELSTEETHAILCKVRHALPEHFRNEERQKFLDTGSVDKYIEIFRREFLENLASCRDTGTLFYNQPISQQAFEFVESNPEISGVVRDGDYLYKTKIPYMLEAYLAADDEDKPYFACHCPWARESLNRKAHLDTVVSSDFCSCSAGFVVQPFEKAFDTKLEVETLETALDGKPLCRFRMLLPKQLTRSRS